MKPHPQKAHGSGRLILFDDAQSGILYHRPPLILIGSAGSGKTSLVLEKLKTLQGEGLYVTLSPYLVHHARRLYGDRPDAQEEQAVDFLSFEELLGTLRIPRGQEITAPVFLAWVERQSRPASLRDGQKLYEEFRGVIAGSSLNAPYLSEEAYLNLGIRQAIYGAEERKAVYQLFQRYVEFLNTNAYFDSSILAYAYGQEVQACYDYVVVDEVQDFTNSQLAFILKTLKDSHQFLLCGDANQIVYPNFFSWSKLKSQFYQNKDPKTADITRILTRNYRNTPEVTALANGVLKVKNARFRSVDRESHLLMESHSSRTGQVCSVPFSEQSLKDLNEQTRLSTHYAVLVLTDGQKEKARQYFETPLLFSIQEAKGLEYENVILFCFMDEHPPYTTLARGLTQGMVDKEFTYGRAKDKADKSLEIYKFYINALYVAITRAMGSVYFIEPDSQHPLLTLLGVQELSQGNAIKASPSSFEEWQKESSRLAQQGKMEQAKAIEQQILKQQEPEWKPLGFEDLDALKQKICRDQTGTKQEKLLLLEYAMLYGDHRTLLWLHQDGFHAAQNIPKSRAFMEEKYVSVYRSKNTSRVHSDIAQYGLEHRSLMNFTPLMSAAYCGNEPLIGELLDLGASRESRDLQGRIPLQIALFKHHQDPKAYHSKVTAVYNLLKPDSISLKAEDKLIKIDCSRAEYLLFHLVLLLQDDWIIQSQLFKTHTGFTAQQISEALTLYDETLCPAYRKKRTYASGLLSRNEVNSNYRPNRKLFLRSERGYYTINPDIHIKTEAGWVPVSQICHFKNPHLTDEFLWNPLMNPEQLNLFFKTRESWKSILRGKN